MEVFLARHGETEWNRAGRRQGQLDSPLTPEGRAEVQRMAERLRAPGAIDAIFSSPIGRALTTAQLYADALGLTVVVVDELAEIHHGDTAGLRADEIEEAFPGALAARAADKYRWCFPGGESYADGDVRAAAALRVLTSSGAERPLVVSHEMIERMLLRHLLDLSPAEALAYGHPHGVVYRVDVAARSLDEIRL
jgi:broad specificity phosphatase PhoE